MDKKTEEKKTKRKAGEYGDYMWVSSIGIHFVISSIAGLFAGIYIDKWLNTKPVFTLVLFIVGLGAGFRQIYKELKKIGQDQKQ